MDWSFSGPFGTYDRHALQRGLQVYREVCSTCHSLKYVAFRNLADLGYTEDEVKAIAAEYTITDGPNDEGEMFERPGRSEEHTSELQSLMRISYAVFCLKKTNQNTQNNENMI